MSVSKKAIACLTEFTFGYTGSTNHFCKKKILIEYFFFDLQKTLLSTWKVLPTMRKEAL